MRSGGRLRASAGALLVVAFVAASVPGAAHAADSASPAASAAPKVLRIGTTTAIDNPNIWAVNSTTEWEALNLQYDMVMKFGDTDLNAAPSLATGCDHSADFRTWTCTLRSGVKWSDGQPLTSKDVAFSYKFAIDKGFSLFSGYFPDGTTFSTPNDTTLVWKSPTPTNGPMVPAWAYVVPEHVWSKYLGASSKQITSADVVPVVSSGPYQMTSATPGQNWTFTRNPNYWGTAPAYDKIVYQLYTNQDALVQALKNGQVDIADALDGSVLPALQKLSNVTVNKVVSDWWVNLAFNFGGRGPGLPALQNLDVRKAIEMAIDKQQIVDKVYPGAAAPGQTIVRPLSKFWHLTVPTDKAIPYDPAAANALLDTAGYRLGPDGVRVDPKSGQPLVIRMPVSDDTAGSDGVGQLVAGFLKKIGITVKVQPVTAGKMYDLQQSGDFDAYIWYWSGDPDPNYQLSVFTSDQCGEGLSDGCWKNAQYDTLFAQQQTTFDQTARKAIVDQMQQLVYDQVPVVVIAYPNAIEAYRNDHVTIADRVPQPDGYILPQYSVDALLSAHPPAGDVAVDSSPGLSVWAWLLAGLVILGLVVFFVIRGRRSEDDLDRA